jgi:ABC-type cobalamin/Fe3+-siderophores transport system ATPase subunit
MRFRNRPLLVDGVDEELYVARPAVEERLRDEVRAGRNALLIGPPGSGKTTLLRKLAADLRAAGATVAAVNASLAEDGVGLLALVADALGAAVTLQETPRGGESGAPLRLLAALDWVPADEPAVVLVDGTIDADAAYDVFGRLRDQLWELPHTWVLATTEERSGALRTPPADAFWPARVDVPPMREPEITRLLRNGLSVAERARIAHRMPEEATPRRVIGLAQDLLNGRPVEQSAASDRLGGPEATALAALEALHRPASAGDEELLARLGWTRAYAGRVLAELLAAGAVRSFPGPVNGQGRPPKLYEPVGWSA